MDKYIPLIQTLKEYQKSWLRGDISAGLTVGVMLIPQGMAYAMIAGLPPIYGLYASTIPLIIYALLGTSRQLAVGPVAMVSLITASSIGLLAESGSTAYIQMAITLALLVGVIQVLLGVFKLGFLVNFLSHPVISGFTSAAAIIIGMSQLKHLLGIDLPRSHHVHEILIEALQRWSETNWISLAIGVGGIAIIVLSRKIHNAIPGALLAVVFGIMVVWSAGLITDGVKIVGEIPEGLPSFAIPSFSISGIKTLLPTAIAISLVGFMESIAVAKAIQFKHKNYKVVPDQELLALGLANVGGSFVQSFPVTGGFSRTAVNDQSGAKSGIATLISAFLIIITLLFLTPLFYYLPNAILASIIMVAVFGLIDFKEIKHLWQTSKPDLWMLLVTFVATLTLGIEQGIGTGVILSLAMIIYKSSRPHIAELGKIPNTKSYRNFSRFNNLEERDELLIVRFDNQLYFANSSYLIDHLNELILKKGDNLKTIILSAKGINHIDSSGVTALEEIVSDIRNSGRDIYFTDVIGPVRDIMTRSHLIEKIGKENFFLTIQNAVDHYDNRLNNMHQNTADFILQNNVN